MVPGHGVGLLGQRGFVGIYATRAGPRASGEGSMTWFVITRAC
jgi:hypothetical protein